jgi:DNA modification methylase
MSEPGYHVFERSSAQMAALADGEVDLVFTSPPYFSDASEERLRVRKHQQTDYDRLVREITEFALSLRPIFAEIERVLQTGRFLVLQTKHIRYGDALIPLTDLHAELALNTGLRLVSKVEWLGTGRNPNRVPAFAKQPRRFGFRALDTETFLIFRKGDRIVGEALDDALGVDVEELILPLWRTAPAAGRRHAYASPPEVVRRFVELLSAPGDLVLDPFCGFGTVLKVAARLGRRAVGYDTDPTCVRESERLS